MDDPLMTLQGAGFYRAGRWLVHGVDLSIGAGEIVTLIGPNGSGKTTTVKMGLGLYKADAGEVWRRPALKVGYVPQKVTVDRTMPMSVARLMRLTDKPGRKAVADALALVGMAHMARAQAQTLSGGEMQRVLIARAIAKKPDLLVLDEPVQGIDFSSEVALYDLIERIREETGCGVLLISHDLHVVMARTDRVICLNGHVCCSGSPQSVAQNPEYRRLFGPQAAQTLGVYRHAHDHAHGPDDPLAEDAAKVHDHA